MSHLYWHRGPTALIEAINAVDKDIKNQEDITKSKYAHFKTPTTIKLIRLDGTNRLTYENTKKQLRLFYNWKLCNEIAQDGRIKSSDAVGYNAAIDGLIKYHSSNAMTYQDASGNLRRVEFSAWIRNAHKFVLSQTDAKKLSIILNYKQVDSADYMLSALNTYNWIKYNTDRYENSGMYDFWITWLNKALESYIPNNNVVIFNNKLHTKLFEAIALNDRSVLDQLLNMVPDEVVRMTDDRIMILEPENMTAYDKNKSPQHIVYDFTGLPALFAENTKSSSQKPTTAKTKIKKR